MSEDEDKLSLVAYEAVSDCGFAQPLFHLRPLANDPCLIALADVPGDSRATIAKFIGYRPGSFTSLPVESCKQVKKGDAWIDVFLWQRKKHVGTAVEIWTALTHESTFNADVAPVALLALADIAAKQGARIADDELSHLRRTALHWWRQNFDESRAERWLLGSYLRGQALRMLRWQIKELSLGNAAREALGEVDVLAKGDSIWIDLPATLHDSIDFEESGLLAELRLLAASFSRSIGGVRSTPNHVYVGGASLPDAADRVPETAQSEPMVPPSRPDWASDFGPDQYGFWASFTVRHRVFQTVSQRLRWIPPGRFRMGSPPDEPGRWDADGPLHDVAFKEGFWLFDTPVTQALWQAVMGNNPSRFKDKQRPVERVSYDDVQEFLAKANKTPWGKGLVLPSEAQWEYACRAGRDTATYAGPIEILGENRAPVLDAIAWYRGNSGVDFDLRRGVDSSDWKEKQHPHKQAGTRKVARKLANPWGLYDMLGNVWEWCEGEWHDSHEGAPSDGSARAGGRAAERVVRGGSWLSGARSVRAASRGRCAPDDRNGDIGFRCARVQV